MFRKKMSTDTTAKVNSMHLLEQMNSEKAIHKCMTSKMQ
jgi:hypothetical protein